MNWRSRGGAARVLLVPSLAVVAVSAAGCSASACAGSGCDSGKVLFGTNFKQSSIGGVGTLEGPCPRSSAG